MEFKLESLTNISSLVKNFFFNYLQNYLRCKILKFNNINYLYDLHEWCVSCMFFKFKLQ